MSVDPTSQRPIRLLLVENGGAEAARVRATLEATVSERFEIATATRTEDALQALRDLSYDVLLLDLSAQGGGDLEPLLRAKVAAVDTPIVVLAGAGSEEDAVRVLRAGAQEYLTQEECSALRLARTISQAVERHRIQRELEVARRRDHFQATHDALTGLANREAFLERLSSLLAHAARNDRGFAVLFLDLDHFKLINDSLGHATGDLLLRFVTERVVMTIRKSDLVARFGGDEFVLAIQDVTSPADPATVASNLLARLSEPYLIERLETWVTASIGIAMYPDDGADAEELLRNSDMAMYRAKLNGRNNFQFCTAAMNDAASRRLLIRAGMASALEQGRLSVTYQPIRDVRTGRVTSAEALIRWEDPHLGEVRPGEFVPIAEDTGLIVPVGQWVLREACRQARRWQDQGFRPIRISVNVSGRQLRQHTLVATVADILAESGLDPSWLDLEITEGVLVQGDRYVQRALEDLGRMEVGLSIDDFGTGYSALSYLHRFAFDRLKLDRSFVTGVGARPENRVLVRAILAMARSLGLRSLAEGVENEEQARFLIDEGCDELQGFLVGAPLAPAEFVRFLERDKAEDDSSPGPN